MVVSPLQELAQAPLRAELKRMERQLQEARESAAHHEATAEESREHRHTLAEERDEATERLVLASGGVVARLSGLYGPGRCHVLKNLVNGTAHLDGAGDRMMNFIHRDDAARAMLLLSGFKTAV